MRGGGDAEEVVTMTGFLGTEGSNVDVDLVVLMTHIQAACKHIAAILASPTEMQASLSGSSSYSGSSSPSYGTGRDEPKPLDIVSVGGSSDSSIYQVFVCYWSRRV
jgi:fructose-1,6-bisphosphatase I